MESSQQQEAIDLDVLRSCELKEMKKALVIYWSSHSEDRPPEYNAELTIYGKKYRVYDIISALDRRVCNSKLSKKSNAVNG